MQDIGKEINALAFIIINLLIIIITNNNQLSVGSVSLSSSLRLV